MGLATEFFSKNSHFSARLLIKGGRKNSHKNRDDTDLTSVLLAQLLQQLLTRRAIQQLTKELWDVLTRQPEPRTSSDLTEHLPQRAQVEPLMLMQPQRALAQEPVEEERVLAQLPP